MGYRLLIGTSKGPFSISIHDRRRTARVSVGPRWWGEAAYVDCLWADEGELAEFISEMARIPREEAVAIAAQAIERVRTLRSMGLWKRLTSRETAGLRQFRAR
ncbi:MAG: hypothetical protein WD770_11215 [Actinomycetota bacterium]